MNHAPHLCRAAFLFLFAGIRVIRGRRDDSEPRKREAKRSAGVDRAAGPDASAVLADNPVHGRESDSRAFEG